MYNTRKIVSLVTAFVLLVFIIVVVIIDNKYNRNKKELPIIEEIPPIVENFEVVSLESLFSSNEKEDYYYSKYDNEVVNVKEDGSSYIIGEYNKLYDTPIRKYYYEEDNTDGKNEYDHCNDVRVFVDDNSNLFYYTIPKANMFSDKYELIQPLKNMEDECKYMLIGSSLNSDIIKSNNYKYYLYDTYNYKTHEFDDDIINVIPSRYYNSDMSYVIDNNSTELIIEDKNNMYGLSDYNANIILKPKYDEMKMGYNGTFIIRSNNKYGLIDKNEKVLLPTIYDAIESFEHYYLVAQNGKIAVLNNKLDYIVDYSIEYHNSTPFVLYSCCEENLGYYADEGNDKFLTIYTHSFNSNKMRTFNWEEDYEESIKYSNYYVINSNGLVLKANGDYVGGNTDYTVIANKNQRVFTFSFYDKDYKFRAAFSLISDNDYDNYYVSAYSCNETNNVFQLTIENNNNVVAREYVNPDNRETVDTKDAFRQYFPNGYNFIYNNNKLSIYKDEELMKEYSKTTACQYIGDYMFILNRGKGQEIVKVKFN